MSDWLRTRAAHEQRVDDLLAGHRYRSERGLKHPVEDFLFEYYTFRPAHLRRWHPGAGVVLGGAEAAAYLAWPGYREVEGGVSLDPTELLKRRGATVRWVAELLAKTASRPPRFGCFGMHEWAMVYGLAPKQTRHSYLPLRYEPGELARIVEEVGVSCTHYDAFRFFTAEARPLNRLQPTRQSQPELEQPGCLHAGMDLYRWAYKLSPLVDSGLVVDCFELARDIRELDMRASPYDLREYGLSAVAVETSAGRAEYAAAQRAFSERGVVLRERLLAAVTSFPVTAD